MLSLSVSTAALAATAKPLEQIEEAIKEEKTIESPYFATQMINIFLDEAEVTAEAKGNGRIFPFADAKITEIKDGKLKLEILGWKPENVPHVIYAEKGKRIMKALIAKDKAENIQILGQEMDEETGQNWQQVSLSFWTALDSFIADEKGELLDQYGQELLTQACVPCHNGMSAHHHLANQWPSIAKSMKRFVSLDDEAWSFLQYYLQYNAKDMVKTAEH